MFRQMCISITKSGKFSKINRQQLGIKSEDFRTAQAVQNKNLKFTLVKAESLRKRHACVNVIAFTTTVPYQIICKNS